MGRDVIENVQFNPNPHGWVIKRSHSSGSFQPEAVALVMVYKP
jgi:hypothetical protein